MLLFNINANLAPFKITVGRMNKGPKEYINQTSQVRAICFFYLRIWEIFSTKLKCIKFNCGIPRNLICFNILLSTNLIYWDFSFVKSHISHKNNLWLVNLHYFHTYSCTEFHKFDNFKKIVHKNEWRIQKI